MTTKGQFEFQTAKQLQTQLRDLAGRKPRALPEISFTLQSEGAGNTGCALHPRSRVQTCTKTRTRAYRFSGGNPAFPAQWFYGLYRALLGVPGLIATVARAPWRELDASVGASGPHDFAVRKKAPSSMAPLASTASRPAAVTIACRPSKGTGPNRNIPVSTSPSSLISENQK